MFPSCLFRLDRRAYFVSHTRMTSAALSLRSRTSGRVARLGLAAAFVLLGMSVAVLLLVPRYSRPVALADVGTTAPDFHLRDTAGREVTLGDQRGRPVVLFFQSRATAQHYDARIEQLAQHFAGDGRVAFLGVEEPMALGTPDAAAELAADTIAPASLSTEQPFPTLVDDHGSVALRYIVRFQNTPLRRARHAHRATRRG